MYKIFTLIFIALPFCLYSQNQIGQIELAKYDMRIDSLKKLDFLSMDYKFLNNEFKIQIDSTTFSSGVEKYHFYPEKILTYKDSLIVVLMIQFDDWPKAKIAKRDISYSWLRLGYHTWQTPDEARNFAQEFGISHPWRMKLLLMDDNNDDQKIINFYVDLKNKLIKNNLSGFEKLNRKDLLTFAMQKNPQHIADYEKMVAGRKRQREAYLKEHGEVDPRK
ncbi:hypothetical protein [Plebeiibacterium marinum]|uniref:Uncharacterized protein n=1 Tax=Plebeiibacterium marinum TaxID=2992111 RepID=A0AAE3M9Y3_9BACT|nr:hypothetical protein [Plebeiobacterium marinum]MCW3804018.1 hypothetical protein [Plebeiobacterium marinum]